MSRMCCSTVPQSGVRMHSCMIYRIYTIHSRVLQSRHYAADHTEAHLKLIQSCLLFQLNEESLENQDVQLSSSGCLLVFYLSTLLVKLLLFLQKKIQHLSQGTIILVTENKPTIHDKSPWHTWIRSHGNTLTRYLGDNT